ncbi:MAG: hypothetical protein HYW48_10660 [Deltaproteobacteria bacterium]|nr:hypothetical protein [Deltaproteobacteria bacterium]
MQVHIPFSVYKKRMRLLSNHALSLGILLKPFGITPPGDTEDPTLCVGHVLDYLASEFYDFECIDPLDVAIAAIDLNFAPAQDFLKIGPHILGLVLKDI